MTPGPIGPSLGRSPLVFVENLGQWESPARFAGRRPDGATLYLAPDSLWLQLSRRAVEALREGSPRGGARLDGPERRVGVNLRLQFEGSRTGVRVAGREPTPTRFHYFVGNDPRRWRAGVRGFGKVAYEGLYEGVELLVREEGTVLEYDLVLSPEADLSSVVVRVEGADAPLRLDAEGSLLIDTAHGEIRQPRPRAWEVGEGGERRAVDCAYRVLRENRFGFDVPARRRECALVVDPELLYSTYLGGGADDAAFSLALDATGAAVVAGRTISLDFPTSPGAFDATNDQDAFVTRLPLSGAPPFYSTFLGGGASDTAVGLALDATGAAVVAGYTLSADFPTTPGAYDTTGGYIDAFVTRLPMSGGPPSYSTYLGGGASDLAYAVALDAAGAAVVAGHTYSAPFPLTPGAFDTTFNSGAGSGEGFVTRVPLSGGPLAYSTYLGGSGDDAVFDLALDPTGAAIVAGKTGPGLPVTPGAFDPTWNGSADGFVARLPLSGSPPPHLTYFGGADVEYAYAVALDASGAAVVTGYTVSSGFPVTPGCFDSVMNGSADAFVTRLPLSAGPLLYSTFLGGGSYEAAHGVALDSTGTAVVAGITDSPDFPISAGAYDPDWNGAYDTFVTRLRLTGAPPSYSTFFGGSEDEYEYGKALALDGTDTAIVTGVTESDDLPVTLGAVSWSAGGSDDAFVARMDLLPAGATAYGTSTPGCAGLLPIGVTSSPQVGNSSFSITCGHAPSNGIGALGFSPTPLGAPLSIQGVQSWIDWGAPGSFALREFADAFGVAQVPVPIPAVPSLAGAQVYLQFAWMGPSAPAPCPPTGISASNALAVVVQP
ncbi:MAG: hypothetical protein L0323_22705 [Planctomycetes bacterium]|nr:hypothetical protein [Planctomycetota bacterium]